MKIDLRQAEICYKQYLQHLGLDPDSDQHLRDTPHRVVKAWSNEFLSGYFVNVGEVLKTGFDEDKYDQMIVCDNISFVSMCSHHMLPFSGVAKVGYVPSNGRVVGLSKLARVVEVYARRLQIQERMTFEIADALIKHINPAGVGVIVRAQHSCMTCRGILKPEASMVTSFVSGCMRDEPATRAEFLGL